MPKSWLTYGFCISFLVTTFFLQWFQLPSYPLRLWFILGFLELLGFFGFLFQRFRTTAPLLVVCVLGFSLAFLRIAQTTHVPMADSMDTYAVGEPLILHGVIAEEPDRRPLTTKYTVRVDRFFRTEEAAKAFSKLRGSEYPGVSSEWRRNRLFSRLEARNLSRSVTGRVLVTDHAAWPPHAYGDEVLVWGKLERPGQIEDFFYDRYLSRYGIYAVAPWGDVETLSVGHGNPLFSFLFDLKSNFESRINRIFGEPHASFLAGLLTGSRRGIPGHLLEDFNRTGLTHIIAISGYNVTIVILFVSALLFFLPARWRFFPSVVAIVLFTFFVGASASVIRAAIMGILGLLAFQVGRQKHTIIAILVAAFLMVAWNPKVLWYDVSFQLSFLAVLGLTFLGNPLERWSRWLPKAFRLREAFQMTIAAQVFAVPLIIVLFDRFSLISPLANVLIAPFIPAAMLVGFAGVMLSFLWFPLGQVISFVAWGCLETIIYIARIFAAIPYASVDVAFAAKWMLVPYYVLLAFFLHYIHVVRPRLFRDKVASIGVVASRG
jgi:competence protein ComEC